MTDSQQPDYRMTCKRCGGRFLEMKDLLFHKCKPEKPEDRPPRRKPKRRNLLKNRAGIHNA